VFCITAGGGRVLNLLYDHPQEILAVDVEPDAEPSPRAQIAAMRALSYEPTSHFSACGGRAIVLKVYQGLRPALATPRSLL